jgi:N-hydroxyarylamine O-acetyltransferase
LLQAYLERISFGDKPAPTLEVLDRLLSCHVYAIPFENLDVQLGRRLTTSPAEAYDKIVNRSRGGWCYEQNGLFGWALAEIGFETTRVAAAVMRADRGEIAEANHLCLLVNPSDADQTFLVDVGFGGSLVSPIALQEAAYDQAPFQLGLRRSGNGYWQFWEDAGDGEFSFDFRPVAADEDVLQAKCEFLQTHPSSGFVQNLVAQTRLPDAHITLRGKVFSRATTAGIETRIIESAEELVDTLRETFALDVPEVADLWPRIEARHEEVMREKAVANTYEIRSLSNTGSGDD